jgi:hypothetical protein
MSDTTQKTQTFLNQFRAFVVLVIIIGIGFFVYFNATNDNSRFGWRLALSLRGRRH